jgi:preprotein translocase subunit YajC
MFDLIATAAAAAAPQAKQNPFTSMIPVFLIVIIFMFFMSRSQKKQQQKRQDMLNALVRGKEVMLANGIYGKISEVKENTFMVEIASGVCVEVAKNGVAEVIEQQEAGK